MEKGWITLNRKLLDNPIANKPEYLALWITCLLRANHKDIKTIFNNQEVIIKKGSFITGRKILAQQTGIKESTLERILTFLELSNQITQIKTTKHRIITIINWDKYQQVEKEDRVKSIYIGTQEEIQEIENLINSLDWLNKKAWLSFAEERKKKSNSLTIRAVKIHLKMLSENKNDQVEIIANSIKSGWHGLFPLKKNDFKKSHIIKETQQNRNDQEDILKQNEMMQKIAELKEKMKTT